MLLNSIHEQRPNSDPKQCTITKLGWVHSAHTQNPGRAQCPCRGRCCAHNKLVARMSRTQLAQVSRSTCTGRAHSAQVVGAAARTTSWSRACRAHSQRRSRAQRAQVARIVPRSWAHVATSFPCPAPGQVATSLPGRDVNPMSRPPFCPTKTTQIATPISIRQAEPCRDIKSVSRHHSGQSRSRPQNGVATPNLLSLIHPGRDVHLWS